MQSFFKNVFMVIKRFLYYFVFLIAKSSKEKYLEYAPPPDVRKSISKT